MAREAKYRPAARGDGMGSVRLSADELADLARLRNEADQYAIRFIQQINSGSFFIGVPEGRTNRAFVFVIEAAKQLCAGDGDPWALELLVMAIREILEQNPNEQQKVTQDVAEYLNVSPDEVRKRFRATVLERFRAPKP
jgi:hypothetical protein